METCNIQELLQIYEVIKFFLYFLYREMGVAALILPQEVLEIAVLFQELVGKPLHQFILGGGGGGKGKRGQGNQVRATRSGQREVERH